jgi:signal-transduction protein with cAMP-binding, CBS, and nucleotidyltransferase domain
MANTVADVMTPSPVTVEPSTTLVEVAKQMDREDIGEVLVAEGDRLCGLVTDRDIVVRAIAEGRDPATTQVDDICTHEVMSVSPDDVIEDAVRIMSDRAVRRLPVLENGKPVGVVTIGDIAAEREPRSALGAISNAPPDE